MAAMDKPAFANSFWGDNDKGLEVLMTRMRQGKHVCQEVHDMLKERASLEEDYGKRLNKLAKSFSPKEEIGTLRDSLDVVKFEIEKSAKTHLDLAAEIRTKLEKPLSEFISEQSGIRKSHHQIVEKHQKAKAAQVSVVMKIKERYENKCEESNQLAQTRPDPNTKDAEKLKLKLHKTQAQAKQADAEYMGGVEKLTEIHRRWVDDFRAACVQCQQLEQDRFHFLRNSIWDLSNFLAAACVSDDEACERIRVSLESCDFEKDLTAFLDRSSTGADIPQPLQYVNYYSGTMEASRMNSGAEIVGRSDFGPVNSAPEPYGYDRRESTSASASDRGSIVHVVPYSNSANGGPVGASQLPMATAPTQGLPGPEHAPPPGESDMTFQYDPYDVPESMPVLFSVRVLYDYQAQAPEELSIGKGQLVPVIATHDDGWWEGLGSEGGRRRKGLFPSNFTETVK
ncbi:hypothetical protein BC832DRAFT_207169 [Gaertneriomyces semiglobifer]|nr:hypothetical protein BC832DRAFT_207169 [Gaertneriomyces semiglobifer]